MAFLIPLGEGPSCDWSFESRSGTSGHAAVQRKLARSRQNANGFDRVGQACPKDGPPASRQSNSAPEGTRQSADSGVQVSRDRSSAVSNAVPRMQQRYANDEATQCASIRVCPVTDESGVDVVDEGHRGVPCHQPRSAAGDCVASARTTRRGQFDSVDGTR